MAEKGSGLTPQMEDIDRSDARAGAEYRIVVEPIDWLWYRESPTAFLTLDN